VTVRIAARLALVFALGAGCAHRAAGPGGGATDWIYAGLAGDQGTAALERLAHGDATARTVRLDRLLDLLDAARFAQDADARETLWIALGGHTSGVGPQATREALARLLQEALAIEAAADRERIDADRREWLGAAIGLLTTDLEPPRTAEELSIRTLSWRALAEGGHPRVADNARWRLYDHVRGTLQAAVEAPPERRMEIAVQALYAARERVDDFLADTAAHARPAWPSPKSLADLLLAEQTQLGDIDRWRGVVASRRKGDDALRETVLFTLPAERDPTWPVARVPRGSSRGDSLAPVVLVDAQAKVTVDAGRIGARSPMTLDDPIVIADAIDAALVEDGRGTMLLALPPMLPSPDFAALLRAARRSQTARIELAVREPRIAEGEVVMVLPMEIVRPNAANTGGRAFLDARIGIHVDGRGARVAVDGKLLSQQASGTRDVGTLLGRVAKAWPRERIVRLTIGAEAVPQQLVDVLVGLGLGPGGRFEAVGWVVDGGPPASGASGDATLATREALATRGAPKIEQPFPLRGGDQQRLQDLAGRVAACVPELERPIAAGKAVRVRLRFAEGRVAAVEPEPLAGAGKPAIAALRSCIADEALGVHLAEHRDAIAVVIELPPR
jgi:hypothetical protein